MGRTERPTHLASFIKPISAIIGPDDEIRYPLLTQELDYEVELVAVMGTPVTPMTADAVPRCLGTPSATTSVPATSVTATRGPIS